MKFDRWTKQQLYEHIEYLRVASRFTDLTADEKADIDHKIVLALRQYRNLGGSMVDFMWNYA